MGRVEATSAPFRVVRAAVMLACTLAAGAAITVLVAWLSAVLFPFRLAVELSDHDRPAAHARVHANAHPALPGSAAGAGGLSVRVTRWTVVGGDFYEANVDVGIIPAAPGSQPIDEVVPPSMQPHATPWLTGHAAWPARNTYRASAARGWPMRALWCEFRCSGVTPWVNTPVGGIELPRPSTASSWYFPVPPVTTLPLRPLWTGLLVNSVCFGVLALVAVRAGEKIQQARRLRAGLCPRCAYDRRGLAPASSCPECGRASGRIEARSTPPHAYR